MIHHTDENGTHWHMDECGRWWAGCCCIPLKGADMKTGEPCCGNCVSYHVREMDGEVETHTGWCGITRPNREYPPTHCCDYHIFKTEKNAITRKVAP